MSPPLPHKFFHLIYLSFLILESFSDTIIHQGARDRAKRQKKSERLIKAPNIPDYGMSVDYVSKHNGISSNTKRTTCLMSYQSHK